MGPTWVLSAPDGPHDGPMNLAIRDYSDTTPCVFYGIWSFLRAIWSGKLLAFPIACQVMHNELLFFHDHVRQPWIYFKDIEDVSKLPATW